MYEDLPALDTSEQVLHSIEATPRHAERLVNKEEDSTGEEDTAKEDERLREVVQMLQEVGRTQPAKLSVGAMAALWRQEAVSGRSGGEDISCTGR